MQDRGVLIHRHKTAADIVEIFEDSITRSLYFGSSAKQSSMLLLNPMVLVLTYSQAMMSLLLFHSNLRRVLVLGLGGGSLVKFIHGHFPQAEIVAVEKRQDIIDVAHDYFMLPRHHNIQIIHDDAMSYLRSCDQCFDAILVDVFDAGGMAAGIAEKRFFSACQQHLTGQGIISMNVWGSNREEYRTVVRTINQVFPTVLKMPVEKKGNIILLGMQQLPRGKWHKSLRIHARQLAQRTGLEYLRFLSTLYRANTPLLRRMLDTG
jgi:spermidine synthase